MRRFVHFIIISIIALAAVRASAQTTAASDLPLLHDLIRITAVDGVLRFEPITDRINLQPLTAQGPEAKWMALTMRPTTTAEMLYLERPIAAVKQPGSCWFISIMAMQEQVIISGIRAGRAPHDIAIRINQTANQPIKLSIVEHSEKRTREVTAANLLDLRLKEPDLFSQFVKPLLAQITDEDILAPGAADVYRVFDDIPPDPQVMSALKQIVPKLSSPAFPERESASAELDHLGPAGVLAVLHFDTAGLSPETKMRLDTLLTRATHRKFDDSTKMLNDLNFLADCLDYNDEQIHTIAMARIEKNLGHSLPPADWPHAAAAVRREIAAQNAINSLK